MWICKGCVIPRDDKDTICPYCGWKRDGSEEILKKGIFEKSDDNQGNDSTQSSNINVFWMIGSILGIFFGYILSPTIPFGGRVNFIHAFFRGATMEGIDQMLVRLAEQTSNNMLVGFIIGLGCGLLVDYFINQSRKNAMPNRSQQVIDSSSEPLIAKIGQTPDEVELLFGKPAKIVNLEKKSIYIYSDMKLTFVDGKLVDMS